MDRHERGGVPRLAWSLCSVSGLRRRESRALATPASPSRTPCTPLCREFIREHEFNFTARHTQKNIHKFHVLITTYQILLSDFEHLAPIRWRAITIDEAHNLRNRQTQILQVREIHCPRRFAVHSPHAFGGTWFVHAVRELAVFRHDAVADGNAGTQQH